MSKITPPSVKKIERKIHAPKPKFSNPVLGQEFEKQFWRQKIVAANKKGTQE